MKKLVSIVLALLMVAMVIIGCTSAPEAPAESEKPAESEAPAESTEPEESTGPEVEGADDLTPAKEGMKFGLVVKNLSNPYFVTLADGAKKAAEDIGITLDVQATTDDTQINEQINILDTMVTQKYDAILCIPLNNVSVVPWLKRANDAGVPVINLDTAFDEDEMKAQGASVVCKIFTDNISAGEAAAKAIVEALGGEGKVAMLEGTSGATTAEDRKTGFHNVMDKEEGIEVVASIEAKYNRNEAYTVMTNILTANPDVQAVFAANDEMALGAIAAIKEAGKIDQIKVVGVNYGAEIQEAMKAGEALGSVNQDPAWIGYQGVVCANNYLKGQELEYIYQSESVMMFE